MRAVFFYVAVASGALAVVSVFFRRWSSPEMWVPALGIVLATGAYFLAEMPGQQGLAVGVGAVNGALFLNVVRRLVQSRSINRDS